MPVPENSSQDPRVASLEARVSVVEAELKHLATKADLHKAIGDLGKEMRKQFYVILAAMGIMMATLVNLITTYAPPEAPPPPPPPALETPSP